MANSEGTPKKGGQREPIYLVIIALLLIVIGTLGWRLYTQSTTIKQIKVEKEEVTQERKQVKEDLDSMLNEYNQLEVENDSMQERIEKEKERVKELRENIDRYQYSLSKAKDEAKTLRKIMKGFVEDIDSLQQANKELAQENQQIEKQLGQTRSIKQHLEDKTSQMEEDLDKASTLKTSNLRAVGIRHNLLGNPKETERARRTEKFKVCFTINENEFAEGGKRSLYVRIIDPSGKIFAETEEGEAQKFEFEGVRGQYTLKHQVEYEKEEMDLCLYWDLQEEDIEEGNYVAKVYEENREIGSTEFTLE